MNNYCISLERWEKLSLAEQMANIGADVARAIRAQDINDQQRMENAVGRALQQFDLTVLAQKSSPARLKELLRCREVFCDHIYGDNYKKNSQSLDKYFLEFNFLARKNA